MNALRTGSQNDSDRTEASTDPNGWHKLLEGYPWYEGEGCYPIPAYSEFMPPPRLGRAPYGDIDHSLFSEDDPYGWTITEKEEEYELRPGLENIARHIIEHLQKLAKALPENHISGHESLNLQDNPYWPPELAVQAGRLDREGYVVFLPLALSRTQDEMGRVRWTFFGSSEQGPERAFWKGFYSSPEQELPEGEALAFFYRLLSNVYGEIANDPDQLGCLGFRILPSEKDQRFPYWQSENLPSWCKPYLIDDLAPFEGIRYLLTFRPFNRLPDAARQRYLAGELHLLPFPGSLVFWGMPTYIKLQKELPLAMQVPLQQLIPRQGGPHAVRVPQSGWLHQPHPDIKPGEVQEELINDSYIRTHRWNRVHRYENELETNPHVERVTKTLFSTAPDVLGLYDKPMARNVQLWTRRFELLLNGPRATRREIEKAEATLVEGGLFGYRFLFPAMQVGLYEVYWQRLLVAYVSPQGGEVKVMHDAPLGYLTAYRTDTVDLVHPIELWPRLLHRPAYLSALQNFEQIHNHYAHQTPVNIITLLECWQQSGEMPLPRSFARALLRIAKDENLDNWLASLPERTSNAIEGRRMQEELSKIMEPPEKAADLPSAFTYHETATRVFEVAYWNDIVTLAHGNYLNKDNADCVQDPDTLSRLVHHHRDLERLGDYLIDRYRIAIFNSGMQGKAVCGELPFRWRTDFDYPVFGGWRNNQEGHSYERNILVIIPGKNRRQAVVMADHYDTAYMEDLYEASRGGSGVRIAAAGADDNHSATAVLLQAAPVFLNLAREGKLERDIWLLHLTGEEFPSDCMGARHFCQALVEKTMKARLNSDQFIDMSSVQVVGTYVMDMIAHNRDSEQDIFQISPGKSPHSLYLAWQAHMANMIWNAGTHQWNASPERYGRGRGKRSTDGLTIPEIADHLRLDGEVRTPANPHSSLYNTDGQIFSDIGAPVVLFMENYDINRTGYHDTHDTLDNIDLDYGAALAAIAIETVARVAMKADS